MEPSDPPSEKFAETNPEFEKCRRKCRRVTEEYKKNRPRARFIELDDIPSKVFSFSQDVFDFNS